MKVLVLAGTADGRRLGKMLAERGHEVVLSVLTPYGAELAADPSLGTKISVRHGAFSDVGLVELLEKDGFQALLDASHPYANQLHEIAKRASSTAGLPYFRWVRPSGAGTEEGVHWAADIPAAAELAAGFGERILLTTGSKNLPEWFRQSNLQGKTVFVRVLPTAQIMTLCEQLGLRPWQIIAAQGPFSQAWNEALLKQLRIEVMVAKDSGVEGGTPGKIKACRSLNLPLVLLERPTESQPEQDRLQFIQRVEEAVWIPKSFS